MTIDRIMELFNQIVFEDEQTREALRVFPGYISTYDIRKQFRELLEEEEEDKL